MCGTCGCNGSQARSVTDGRNPETVRLEQELLAKNDHLARHNRTWLAKHRVVALNLIGSPGAGKTTLLEHTIRRLRRAARMAVIEGDQATDYDAQRVRATGCAVVQINTGVGCHLDAQMIEGAIEALAPPPSSVLFIENVGNLVCPALFDLGERAKVVVMSVTEGEDKPLKYPHVFQAARQLVLTKADLLPYLDFDVNACVANARRVNPRLDVFVVSSRHGEGIDDWCGWIRNEIADV